jgi:hypothetical protein
VASEHQHFVGAFLRLFRIVDIGEMLLDDRSCGGSSFRHADMTAL